MNICLLADSLSHWSVGTYWDESGDRIDVKRLKGSNDVGFKRWDGLYHLRLEN